MPVFTPAPAATTRVGPIPNLGKCINLANTLEPPNEGDWGPAFRDEDARILRSAGFSTVRVPVNFLGHALAKPPHTLDRKFMARARHVIDTLRASGLSVIVDQHNNDDLSAAPDSNRDRSAAVWRQVAAALRDEPANVWFELLNEPHDKLTNANLLATLMPSLAAIRETNPTRIVVIGGDHWSGVDSLATLAAAGRSAMSSPRSIITIRSSSPIRVRPSFTRRRRMAERSVSRPTQRSSRQIWRRSALMWRAPAACRSLANMARSRRSRCDQRTLYYHTITSAFASLGVASCAWGYRNAFPLWKDGRWLRGMVEAIAAPQ